MTKNSDLIELRKLAPVCFLYASGYAPAQIKYDRSQTVFCYTDTPELQNLLDRWFAASGRVGRVMSGLRGEAQDA